MHNYNMFKNYNIGPAGGDREFVKNIFMYKVSTHASKLLVWWS